jgi:hypothetical protein
MKIYQIHEWGGEWEDRYDYIVGSYLSEEKAIVEKERLEKAEAESEKCDNCPLFFCEPDCDKDCKKCNEYSIDKAKKYCDEYEPVDESNYDMCMNRKSQIYYSNFSIEEVEVIE